ncbi:MAG: tRNA guanosine(34) transglycosylase Tgt [Candidatus Schekmanbacteria bacterium]|nr:MAG: tRNA guanosine(34) transglycosylase Tgt [Candidatus Schekmanbacteria bacterium]
MATQCSSFKFEVLSSDSSTSARRGRIHTSRGIIETPVFMPVGTRAVVKTLSSKEVSELGAEILLCNTYHLTLRPGYELVERMGGLHKFMNWEKPILTDSGGFQVYSLAKYNKILDDGVEFRSHIDGKSYFFTPELVMEIQEKLDSDIVMVFDECIPYPADRKYCEDSVKKTIEWAKRSKAAVKGDNRAVFGIVQGGVYQDLRKYCLQELEKLDFDGIAIGGLSVGEPKEEMISILNYIAPIIDEGKPRYLMGVGTPDDILEAVSAGVDMFDCIIPTRQARNGALFTWNGKIIIKNAQYAEDDKPVDEKCGCFTCRNYTRAYLRHLYQLRETLALRLNTIHNLFFYFEFIAKVRKSIEEGSFGSFASEIKGRWN